MALHVQYAVGANVGTYKVRLKRLADGLFFDFGAALAFSASPVTPSATLTNVAGTVTGAYGLDIASTPVAAWPDGDYAAFVDNGTNTVSILGFTMLNGDAASMASPYIAASVLNAAAASYNTALSIGAKINASGSSGDPLANAVPGTYTAGQAGYVIGTNLNATVSSRSTYAGGDTSGTSTLLTRIPGVVSAQTGDSFARIGVNGAGLTAISSAATQLAANGLDLIPASTYNGVTINLRQAIGILLAIFTTLDESIAGHSKSSDPLSGALLVDTTRTGTGYSSALTPNP